MVVLFGTLGFHPEKLLSAIPGLDVPIDYVVIYSAAQAKTKERALARVALKQVTDTLEAMGMSYEHREFTSPWSFSDMFRVLLRDLQSHRPEEVVFNLTGGPKTMTVAATMACLMCGVRVIYVPEELAAPGAPVELPLLRIRYSQVLTPSQQRVLRAIHETSPATLDELARYLRLKNATVSYHMERLEKMGAVTLHLEEGKRSSKRPRLTTAGEIMLLAEETLALRDTLPT